MRYDRAKSFFRWLGWTAGLCLVAVAGVWLVDGVFNGYVRDWLASFLREANQDLSNLLDWGRVVRASVAFVLALCAMLTTAGFVCARMAARKQRVREINFIAAYVNGLAGAEEVSRHLPREYAEIEAPLMRVKLEGARAQRLFETEMQRKNDLITYLAHDLKTPLASVVAYLNLLEEAPGLPAEQRAKYVDIALQKAYRLEQLIGELFEIIRFNLQNIVLNDEKIRLGRMLEQLADEFYPIVLSQGKHIAVSCPGEIVIRGDSDKLARVFNNILKNAAAYGYPDTEIAIRAAEADGGVEITFTNRGDPIPRQKCEDIFEKFYRLDASRSTQTGGAGLGLAIAREIVEAHGGTISVRSDPERTVFTVWLPVRPTQGKEPPHAHADAHA